MGPAWPDVRGLLESTRDRTARDVRDHAILKLLAIYGLRSGEVRGLCLEDIDWTREVIKVTRSKQRKTQYPPGDLRRRRCCELPSAGARPLPSP